jgi:DNA repair and recombination protein RAD52
LARSVSAGNNPPRQAPQTPVQQPPRPSVNNFPGAQNRGPSQGPRPPQQFNQNRPAAQSINANQNQNQNQNQKPQAHRVPPQAAGNNNNAAATKEPVGFFSARAVKQLPEETLANGTIAPKADQAFNPHYESPSIRRTPGVDRRTSRPVTKSGQHVPPKITVADDVNDADTRAIPTPNKPAPMGGVQQQQQPVSAAVPGPSRPGLQNGRPGPGPGPGPGNVVNPQLDQTRRIGAPPISSSPVGNRGQFRPLTVKRPAAADPSGPGPQGGGGAARVPLEDVSNNPFPGVGAAGGNPSEPDAKRLRTS